MDKVSESKDNTNIIFEAISEYNQNDNQELVKMLEDILLYKPKANIKIISKAYHFCVKYHGDQKRESGENYYTHPIAVAKMIIDMKFDESTISTALLHDTIEDTDLTMEDIKREFSSQISFLVDGVTKLRKIHFQTTEARQSANFRKLFLALSNDIRVVIVKFCDRLHNMKTIEFQPEHKRERTALETLEIYAPLAEMFGMQKTYEELQDKAFKVLKPVARSSIVNRLIDLKKKYNAEVGTEDIVLDIQNMIKESLNKYGIKNAYVIGREKSPYSIWQKLIGKKIAFQDLCDAVAFRVITNSIKDCYKALGIIHQVYHSVPNTFTDYTSTPKVNGYRSIHTAILGPFNHKIEIQIRTKDMDVQVSYGLAAHWQYKQGSTATLSETSQGYNQTGIWIKKVLEMMQQAEDPEEFLKATKLEMYQEQIFVFTQKGEMITLPIGATVLDFAFAANTQYALKCFGAEINSKKTYDISEKIQSGDKIRIITNNSVVPQESWLGKCITGRAQTIIRHKINKTPDKSIRDSGRKVLYELFHKNGISHNEKNLSLLRNKCKCEDTSQLYKKVYQDKEYVSTKIAQNIDSFVGTNKIKESTNIISTDSECIKKEMFSESLFTISTKSGVKALCTIAKCCVPTDKDSIIGITIIGYPIFIHSKDCQYIRNVIMPNSSKFSLSWKKIEECNKYQANKK